MYCDTINVAQKKKRLCIRPETPGDYEAIGRINEAAFGGNAESRLVERLRRTEAFLPELSLVAELEGVPVGYTLFYPVRIRSDVRSFPTLALAPMAVLPECQNKKIGSTLAIAGLRYAQEGGHRSVIVLGHPPFYHRFAFKTASEWGIRAPFDVPDESFMALELVLGELEGKAGVVEYPAEFHDP